MSHNVAMMNGHDNDNSGTYRSPQSSYCKRSGDGTDSLEMELTAPYTYICQMPGKNIRSKLAKAFNHWLKIPEDKLEQVSEIVQMLHNASLMIDDIEDNSILRRGLPVAHSIYGVPRTINCANYAYFMALEKVLQLGHPDATKIYTEQLLELHRGQGKEIYWRDTVSCPTEDQYKQMVIQKTGGLFNLAVRLMQLFSENTSDFRPLVETLGLLFQIRDDYANLRSTEYANLKSFAEDLTEGKFSFPVIYAIQTSTAAKKDSEIINIIRQKPTDCEVKRYCVDLLETLGAFDYTKMTLQQLVDRATQQIRSFGDNPLLALFLDGLSVVFVAQDT